MNKYTFETPAGYKVPILPSDPQKGDKRYRMRDGVIIVERYDGEKYVIEEEL